MTTQPPRIFVVEGMDCADCAKSIERGVQQLPGVATCQISFTSERLIVSGTAQDDIIIQRVNDLGYRIHTTAPPTSFEATRTLTLWQYIWQRRESQIAFVGLLLVLPGIILHEIFAQDAWWIDASALMALALCLPAIAKQAWRSAYYAREFGINALMTIAAIGAVAIGTYVEAGLVIVLFTFGELLEGYSAERARTAIKQLAALIPDQALRLDADERTVTVATHALIIGDRVLITPGARIPCDGVVTSGISEVNQAAITGESRLVAKVAGDEVFAGSINSTGAMVVQMNKASDQSLMAHIIRLVDHAQSQKAPIERTVDRFARWYTPLVVVIAVLVMTVPPLLWGGVWWDATNPTQGWIYRGLALLVVACPCALVLSTPVTLVSALSAAARMGMLIKGGHILERLADVKAVAFDKTGTLTSGAPQVIAVQSQDCTDATHRYQDCTACQEVLTIAAALERQSEHPIARAIVATQSTAPLAQDVVATLGKGVTGVYAGATIFVGSHQAFEEQIPHTAQVCGWAEAQSAQGHTPVLVSRDAQYIGMITVSDTIRDDAHTTIARLRAHGVHTSMLTGDHRQAAAYVGNRVGVDDVAAELLPAAKLRHIEQLKQRYGVTMMVGDGINDTPALAHADIGVAVQSAHGGTAQAMEVADITLTNGVLAQIPRLIDLSQRAMRTIRFNIAVSILVKVVFLVMVLTGHGTMWMAVLADVGTSLVVTANGMRLLRITDETRF